MKKVRIHSPTYVHRSALLGSQCLFVKAQGYARMQPGSDTSKQAGLPLFHHLRVYARIDDSHILATAKSKAISPYVGSYGRGYVCVCIDTYRSWSLSCLYLSRRHQCFLVFLLSFPSFLWAYVSLNREFLQTSSSAGNFSGRARRRRGGVSGGLSLLLLLVRRSHGAGAASA